MALGRVTEMVLIAYQVMTSYQILGAGWERVSTETRKYKLPVPMVQD
jgi:hypothetical protein